MKSIQFFQCASLSNKCLGYFEIASQSITKLHTLTKLYNTVIMTRLYRNWMKDAVQQFITLVMRACDENVRQQASKET